jgi:hypothetical protein
VAIDAQLDQFAASAEWFASWRAVDGPPVPIAISASVWQVLTEAVRATADPVAHARVFRLFLRRGEPRHVVRATEIESAWRNERGVLRWNEGGYPPLGEALRKGGNASIRGDTDVELHDAWWMGREQTDLRILLAQRDGEVTFTAWWARAGTSGLMTHHATDGEPMAVRLLEIPDSVDAGPAERA